MYEEDRLTEMSLSHWFMVASTESGERLEMGSGEAVMRVLVRARMMVVENFMLMG